jgi:signal transduction histidine kinase
MKQAHSWLLIGLGLLGAVLTGFSTLYVLDSSETEAEARFNSAAERVTLALTNRMVQYEQGLVAGAALISAVESIDRAAWGRFVAGQNIRDRFPGIQAMGLAAWVADTDKTLHEIEVRATGLPDYAIRPPGERATYLPILFNEPYEGRNRTVVGFDMLSEPIRRAAITKAASSGKSAISGVVVLAGEDPNARVPGFVFYVPAFTASYELRGMVFAPFRAQDLIAAVQSEVVGLGLALTLRDGPDTLYAAPPLASIARFGARKELAVAGRVWTLTIAGDDRFLSSADEERAWIIAGAGILVTLTLIGAILALIRSKNAEARYRTFATLGSDWLWEQDADQRFTYISDPNRFLAALPKSLIGLSRKELFSLVGAPVDKERYGDLLDRMNRHEEITDFEYSFQGSNGSTATIRLSAKPSFGLHGSFLGYSGISKDISLERVREDALLKAKQSAEAANHAKSFFLATMSHDLRTPLNAIIGFSEIIKDQVFGPDARDRYVSYANDIYKSGQHLRDLIDDILDLAKIEAGELKLSAVSVKTSTILDYCQNAIAEMALKGGVSLSLDDPGESCVVVDPRAMKQVLINLISNAVKFTQPGGSVTVSARDEGDKTVLIIRDTGIGISRDALDRIFDAYYQGDPTITDRHVGTGLGLSISAKLTEAMGGKISIVSALGQGTEVTLTLPNTNPSDDPLAKAA